MSIVLHLEELTSTIMWIDEGREFYLGSSFYKTRQQNWKASRAQPIPSSHFIPLQFHYFVIHYFVIGVSNFDFVSRKGTSIISVTTRNLPSAPELKLALTLCNHKSQAYPEGCSHKNWLKMSGPLCNILSLFRTKIWDFPYPVYEVTKTLVSYFRPDPYVTYNWPINHWP